MSLKDRISADLKAAMRERDGLVTRTLRLLVSELQKAGKSGSGEVDEAGVVQHVKRAIKARKEAARQYREAGRLDLAEKEEAEEAVLERYLPATLDEAATRALVRDVIQELGVTGRSGVGKVMGAIMSRHRSEVDGALVKRLVEEALS